MLCMQKWQIMNLFIGCRVFYGVDSIPLSAYISVEKKNQYDLPVTSWLVAFENCDGREHHVWLVMILLWLPKEKKPKFAIFLALSWRITPKISGLIKKGFRITRARDILFHRRRRFRLLISSPFTRKSYAWLIFTTVYRLKQMCGNFVNFFFYHLCFIVNQ